MLKIYFGEWGSGKLQRLPYLGYHILLMVIIFAIIFGAIIAVGATGSIMGGNIADTQAMFMDKFGILAIIFIVVLMFAAMIGQVNILGKRLRDMGLPVLWSILGIIVLSMVLNILFPPHEVTMAAVAVHDANTSATAVAASSTTSSMVVQLFDFIVLLCLLFIPSNTFGNKTHY